MWSQFKDHEFKSQSGFRLSSSPNQRYMVSNALIPYVISFLVFFFSPLTYLNYFPRHSSIVLFFLMLNSILFCGYTTIYLSFHLWIFGFFTVCIYFYSVMFICRGEGMDMRDILTLSHIGWALMKPEKSKGIENITDNHSKMRCE